MKKLIPIALVLVVVFACAFAFAACNNTEQYDPYYGKTFTLTGLGKVDWDSKASSDSYNLGEKNVYTKRELLTKYWDKIDWDVTLGMADLPADAVPHATVDEFVAIFEETEQNYYADLKDLSFTISQKSDLQLTLTLPQSLMEYPELSNNYSAKMTMPLYEINDTLAANKPFADFPLEEQYLETPGYSGLGIYAGENGHFLRVRFSLGQFDGNLWFDIYDYQVDGDGHIVDTNVIYTHQNRLIGMYDKDGRPIIMDIYCQLDYEVK